jgi:4-carboxymuconolactone decarboxylase
MTAQNQNLHSTEDRRDVIAKLEELAPDFVGMISDFALGKVYDRPILDDQLKEVVAITALISLGSERLQGHLESALAKGFSKEQLTEVIMLSSIYLGFPRAIDAMLVLHSLTDEA